MIDFEDAEALPKPEQELLWLSAEKNNTDGVRKALLAGALIDYSDQGYAPALSIAISNGHRELALLLLDLGASPDARCCNEWMTPLCFAAMHGRTEFIEDLFARGASAEKSDMFGAGPFLNAASCGQVLAMAALAKSGCNVFTTDLLRAGACALAATAATSDALQMAIDLGCPTDALDHIGDTPTHYAARVGSTDCLLLLASTGADLSAKNIHGDTPESAAMTFDQHGAAELIRTLILSLTDKRALCNSTPNAQIACAKNNPRI